MKQELDRITVRFGIVPGLWQKNLSITAGGTSKQKLPDVGLVVKPPYEKGGNAIVTINVPNQINSKVAVRVIAVLTNGLVDDNPAQSRDGKIAFMPSSDNYEFVGLGLSDVDHFEILTGRYRWIEFRNVSLQPDKKTDVQVLAEPAQPATEPEDLLTAKVELVKADEITGRYTWRVNRDIPSRMIYGFHSISDTGKMEFIADAKDGIARKNVKDYSLEFRREGPNLHLAVADSFFPPDSGGKGRFSDKTSWPDSTIFKTTYVGRTGTLTAQGQYPQRQSDQPVQQSEPPLRSTVCHHRARNAGH